MDDDWKPDLKTKICHSLTDLELDFSNPDDFYDFNPVAILRAAPKLQSLTLNVDYLLTVCSDISHWIQEYCPDLTTLVLHQGHEYDEAIPPISSLSSLMTTIATGKKHDHQNQKGLQHIYLRQSSDFEPIKRAVQCMISSLLDINRSQIVTLDLGGPGMICETTLTQLASSPMPSLKALQLIEYGGDINSVKSSVLSTLFQLNTMPHLTHLTIFLLNFVDGNVLEAIASNLNCLEELIGDKNRKNHLRSLTIKTWESIPFTEGAMEILASEENGFIEHLEKLNLGAFSSTKDRYADILRFLGAKQERIKNNKKKMKRLNIFFLSKDEFQWMLSEFIHQNEYPQVKQILAKMDQVAIEWEYSVGEPDLRDGIPGVDSIFERVTNLNYERS
ncbi:hypothetical protein INT45_008640 [Circinella minor]|uniref:Uncharacterized protein n=1 Tax=Circinella minor TaxID=1195481 RepID=A0A8H7S1T2_9FUNG|nr:hypothetical protein INT45_008640 [Circinella minor]